jgi:hypothetical protein
MGCGKGRECRSTEVRVTALNKHNGAVHAVGHHGMVQRGAAIVGLAVHIRPSIEEHLEAGSLAVLGSPVKGALTILGASIQGGTLNTQREPSPCWEGYSCRHKGCRVLESRLLGGSH